MVPTSDKVDLIRTLQKKGGGKYYLKCTEMENESLEFNIFLQDFYESLIHKKIRTYTN